MSTLAVNRPDAEDISLADVNPAAELESCNHLLNDHAAMEAFYEKNGYILLRGVLDQGSVAKARDAMLKVTTDLGVTEPGDVEGKWTGKPMPPGLEESELFAGIARDLIEHPVNLAVMEKVLGEPACSVPIVQYRAYPPGEARGAVHQDGFYSPGIIDYKPVWIALAPCPREAGGLALAVGLTDRGYLHNLAKTPPYPLPRDSVPAEAWATTDYMPGDVLIIHPVTPHTGLSNHTDRLRLTFDSRVQSAAKPSAVAATVLSVTPDSIVVDYGERGSETLSVDKDTFIRVLSPGIREPFESFAEYTKPGMRLVVVREGSRAVMLRKAAEG